MVLELFWGKNARKAAELYYDKDIVLNKLENEFRKIVYE